MNEETFDRSIEKRWGRQRHRGKERGHVWAGVALVIVGGLLLARESGVDFPAWFFTWPMILIGLGLFTAVRHGFRTPVPFILLTIGGIFLADKMSPDFSLQQYIWPIIFIVMGLFFIFRPKAGRCGPGYHPGTSQPRTDEDGAKWEQAMADRNDVIDVTAVFGGVKKNILTKNFRGGEIVTFMGGTEIDLTQTDFQGKVIIDNFNMFGGTKLIVPPDWDVQSQMVAIFGGVEDKRPASPHVNPGKVLYLDGTCIFGGVEIKSF